MDGLASRSLLLASLIVGAALCIGLAATAHFLTAARPSVARSPFTLAPARQPVALPQPPSDEIATSSLRTSGAAPR